MNDFGNFLKEQRGKRSLREVSKSIGVSHSYLNTLEKGYDPRTKKERKPSFEILKKLAKFYNIDYIVLLEKAGYMPEAEKYRRQARTAAKLNKKAEKKDTVSIINPESFPDPNTLKKTIIVPAEYKVKNKIKPFENSDLLDLYYLIYMGKDKNDIIPLSNKGKPFDNDKLEKLLDFIQKL